MERLESRRLAGQLCFLHALFRPMVCHGKKEARGGADGVLVAESGGVAAAAGLFAAQAGFRFYFRLRLHVDSLHSEPHHPSAAQGSAHGLLRLRQELSATVEFLSKLRRAADAGHFLGAAGVAAGCDCGTTPYFLRIGWKSGCVLP